MNANELADELERFESFNGDVFFGTCAVMLRQQQAEIEALKAHPVKELTDEEIDFIFFDLPSGHSIQEFARAILRKAQAK